MQLKLTRWMAYAVGALALIALTDPIKAGLRQATFTSFGGQSVDLMIAVAAGAMLAWAARSLADRFGK